MSDSNGVQPVIYEEGEIDLLELLSVLLHNKWKIIIITLIGAVGSVLFSIGSLLLPPNISYLPNLYSSSAKLLISDDSSSSLIPSSMTSIASLAGINVGGGSSYGLLAVELAKSNPIVDVVVEEFDIVKRYDINKYPIASSREEIRDRLSVELDEDTGVLSISYIDWEPEFSMNFVNRVVELLDDRFSSIGINKNLNQKQLLEEKLMRVNAGIAQLEGEIKAFQQQYGVFSIEQLAEVQIGGLAELKSQLILKELEIKTYTQFARIDDPVVNRMKSERDNLENLIKQMEVGHEPGGYSDLGPSMEDIPDIALEYSHLERELLVQVEIYKLLVQELEMTKLKVEGEGPIFQVLELGQIADKKNKPRRSIICIVVTMVAFIISVIFILVQNYWKNILNDPERIDKLRK
ncbi:MAG: Wzz/FepE/Etk N-terminal domain-containing protein [Spirochaetales bacterium]|uniref:Wzz/FepE/Etk N-terminal domain-containing protein n=1 Tax=Candidatus Thalassospirochaeta sargassi TaxID=3119039 RepID=A0AAJ1MLL8_9SPIO|nr:Wzz/FepE/Etk N-terminal domain-containing protein [Spirochaetales bacterium]